MIIYGRNVVREALRGRRSVSTIWATEGARSESWLPSDGRTRRASDEEITERCGSTAHQGVCAEISEYPYLDGDELLQAENPFLVVLDEIQDPQNLGAICRTAECAGVTGVVIPERRSAVVTPAVCKASAGAVEHLRVARVRNVADFLVAAKRADVWSYGASGESGVSYDTPDYRGGVAFVFGSEGRGLRPRVAKSCDQLVAIPQFGQIGSLNVSAAAAILLYTAVNSRTT